MSRASQRIPEFKRPTLFRTGRVWPSYTKGRWPLRVWCWITDHEYEGDVTTYEGGKCYRCGARLRLLTFAEMDAEMRRDFNLVSGIDDIGD